MDHNRMRYTNQERLLKIALFILMVFLLVAVMSCKARKAAKTKEKTKIELVKTESVEKKTEEAKKEKTETVRSVIETDDFDFFLEAANVQDFTIQPDGTFSGDAETIKVTGVKKAEKKIEEVIIEEDTTSAFQQEDTQVSTDSTASVKRTDGTRSSKPTITTGLGIAIFFAILMAIGVVIWRLKRKIP